jgi:hypothetical protein
MDSSVSPKDENLVSARVPSHFNGLYDIVRPQLVVASADTFRNLKFVVTPLPPAVLISHPATFVHEGALRWSSVWQWWKWRKRWICGVENNLSNSSAVELGRQWTTLKNVQHYGESMLKNNGAVRYISLCMWLGEACWLSCLIYVCVLERKNKLKFLVLLFKLSPCCR